MYIQVGTKPVYSGHLSTAVTLWSVPLMTAIVRLDYITYLDC